MNTTTTTRIPRESLDKAKRLRPAYCAAQGEIVSLPVFLDRLIDAGATALRIADKPKAGKKI
jgi:hypothetical protein